LFNDNSKIKPFVYLKNSEFFVRKNSQIGKPTFYFGSTNIERLTKPWWKSVFWNVFFGIIEKKKNGLHSHY